MSDIEIMEIDEDLFICLKGYCNCDEKYSIRFHLIEFLKNLVLPKENLSELIDEFLVYQLRKTNSILEILDKCHEIYHDDVSGAKFNQTKVEDLIKLVEQSEKLIRELS